MSSENKNIIFFDGICTLCNSSIDFFVKNAKDKSFYIASLQGETAQKTLFKNGEQDIPDSIILYTQNKIYYKSSAVLRISKYLKFPLNILPVFFIIPKFIRDWVYDYIAKNRYKWFGQKNTCRIPNENEKDFFLK